MVAKRKLVEVETPPPPVRIGQDITEAQLRRWIESGEERSVINARVTPELAQVMMGYTKPGDTNRKVRSMHAAIYTRAIREDGWINTGEPLIFTNGTLLADGQHRVTGIVEAGLTVVADLRFGIGQRAFAAMNSGLRRSAADALMIQHQLHSRNTASVARLALAYHKAVSDPDRKLTEEVRRGVRNDEIVAAVERWPDIVTALAYTHTLPRRMRNAATQTLGFFAHRTANEATVREFFHVLHSGEGRADNPPHLLRERLLRHSGGQDSGTRARFLAMGILAWNAYRAGKTMKTLDWTTAKPFPTVDTLQL